MELVNYSKYFIELILFMEFAICYVNAGTSIIKKKRTHKTSPLHFESVLLIFGLVIISVL